MELLWCPVSRGQRASEQESSLHSDRALTCWPVLWHWGKVPSLLVQTQPALILFKQGHRGRQKACGQGGRNKGCLGFHVDSGLLKLSGWYTSSVRLVALGILAASPWWPFIVNPSEASEALGLGKSDEAGGEAPGRGKAEVGWAGGWGSLQPPAYLHMLLLLLLSRFSRVRLSVTPLTAAHQAPPTLGFSRQEHWSGLPFPSPMHESEKWKWRCSVHMLHGPRTWPQLLPL